MSELTDNELADALVERGIGEKQSEENYKFRYDLYEANFGSSKQFVTDARVAMACLKAWPTTINVEHLDMGLDEMLRDCRAICIAFVKSTSS